MQLVTAQGAYGVVVPRGHISLTQVLVVGEAIDSGDILHAAANLADSIVEWEQ